MLILAMVMGCEPAWRGEVWSDDGEARASIRQDFDCSSGLLGTNCAEDGPAWLVVDGRRLDVERTPDLKAAADLYYMGTAGYVLYPVVEDGSLVKNSLVDATTGEERWPLDGIPLTSTGIALPSWDGAVVAKVSVEDIGEGLASVNVAFHDPADGNLVEEASAEVEVPVDPNAATLLDSKWVEDELRLDVSGVVVGVTVGGPIVPADAPECWFPRTSSSAWNAEGENAMADEFNWAGDGAGACPDGS